MRKDTLNYSKESVILSTKTILTQVTTRYNSAEKTKIVLKPPEVNRIGKKKTAITNFTSLCKELDRHPGDVMNFFLGDLGA